MLASSVEGSQAVVFTSSPQLQREAGYTPPPSPAQTGAEMAIKLGSTPEWRKSSRSTGNGACVEVKSPAAAAVVVRDSKDPRGPVLTFSPEAWSAFVADVDQGAFELR
jgi:hypothetical protein